MRNIKILVVTLFISLNVGAQDFSNLTRTLLFSVNEPTTVRHAGDGSGRLFIAQQNGEIKIYDGQSLLPTNFINLSSVVNSGASERGLLGLDFDPNYETNGYFFVNYTKSGSNSGDTVIARYKVSDDDPNVADPNSGVIVMRIDQPSSNHNGGDIHFGSDGYLYIGMGDGGGSGDTQNNAQTNSNLLGAMLRIDVNVDAIFDSSFEETAIVASPFACGLDSSPGSYKIPLDNPFVGDTSVCGEIWAYGLRNPYRFSFDKMTGDLIIGDVGQNAYEEVDFHAVGDPSGANFGWRCREGAHDFNTSQCSNGDTYVEPVIDLPQVPLNRCSVMGGYVYRGPIPGIQGYYIFSDYCTGNLNFANPTGETWSFTTFDDVNFGTRGFGEDEDGNVYHIYNSQIYRFDLVPD